jgi:hypothetical protein
MLERSGRILVERQHARGCGWRCELVLSDARLHVCKCLVAQAIEVTGARSCANSSAIGTTQTLEFTVKALSFSARDSCANLSVCQLAAAAALPLQQASERYQGARICVDEQDETT